MSGDRLPNRRDIVAGIAAVSIVGNASRHAVASPALEAELAKLGVPGTFSHLDIATDRLTLANPERAAVRMIPASTFKIANALIALETGAVGDDKELFKWDGKPREFKSWEQDMTLRQAIPASNVPVFQEIARRIGIERYEEWLERLDYGNGRVGDNFERFWLDGPLKISAIEQVSFLAPLALGQLKASKRAQELVQDMLKIESKDGRTLYAKTGWCRSATPGIGWWVGWVTARDRVDAFALNIDMATADDAPKRFTVGKAMLAALDIY